MSMIWGTVRRGSIALAATFLALNMTGSSARAVAGPNAPMTGSSTSVSGSVSPHALVEPSETVRTCANGRLSAYNRRTCDPVGFVDE